MNRSLEVSRARALAEALAASAGDLVRSRFGDPGQIDAKGVTAPGGFAWDLVTEVDSLSEQHILDGIARHDPASLVLAEEGGIGRADGAEPDADRLAVGGAGDIWVVDPLDGTVNFAHGIPHFCVSIALWRDGVPVAGAIRDPMVGETFSFEAATGDASHGWQGRAFHDGCPLVLAAIDSHDTMACLGGSTPMSRDLVGRFRGWRRIGSAALALAWVASGRFGAYVQLGNLMPWDWAAGAPLVLAAGGTVTDGHLGAFPFPLEGNRGTVACAPGIHAVVEADVRALLAGSPAR